MADKIKTKKRKLQEENRELHDQWTEKRCLVENIGSIICMMSKV